MTAQGILILYLVFFGMRCLWETVLSFLNRGYVKARSADPPAWVSEIMDRETYSRSVNYTLTKSWLSLISSKAGSFFLLLIILTGALGLLDDAIGRIGLGAYTHGVLYYFAASMVLGLLALPFTLYGQFVIEERFGFNRMTWKLFLLDGVKGIVLAVILLTPLLYGLFFFMDRTGAYWWIYAFAAFTVFQLVITLLYPSVIAPLFNRFVPLEEGPLRDKINDLADKLEFRAQGIYVMDGSKRTKHSNAYFVGLGRTKRIVLFDTLIEQMEDEEILSVLAHEIAHERKKHTLKRLSVMILVSLLGFWILNLLLPYQPFYEAFGFQRPSYHAVLVLVSFCAGPFTFFLQPLVALWSRKHEYQADRFSIDAMGSPRGLRGALSRLSRNSLVNLTPHPLYSFAYYSHPTLSERIKAMESCTEGSTGVSEGHPHPVKETADES
jgi:STE24 endopeptidase